MSFLDSQSRLTVAEENSPLEPLKGELLQEKSVSLMIKRDDLLHPIISGNKWRKLSGLLPAIGSDQHAALLTMGGAWSNFQHAASFVCSRLQVRHIALTRYHPGQQVTPTMLDMRRWGSTIIPVSRVHFRSLRETQSGVYGRTDWLRRFSWLTELAVNSHHQEKESVYWLSEGGDDELAMSGFQPLVGSLCPAPDYLVMASATGVSVAGMAKACAERNVDTKVIGVAVLNNVSPQKTRVEELLSKCGAIHHEPRWDIVASPVGGGFAKKSVAISEFVAAFNSGRTPLNNLRGENCAPEGGMPACQIEPIYTGRSFYATQELIKANYFPPASRIVLVYCGGMQGARKIQFDSMV